MAGAVVTCLLASTGLHAAPPPTQGVTKAEAANVATAIRRVFGTGVEVVTNHRPYFLIGDFNGDRFRDWLVVVRIKPSPDTLATTVTV